LAAYEGKANLPSNLLLHGLPRAGRLTRASQPVYKLVDVFVFAAVATLLSLVKAVVKGKLVPLPSTSPGQLHVQGEITL